MRSRNIDPLVRWAAVGELVEEAENRLSERVRASCMVARYPEHAADFLDGAERYLLAQKTRALIRHDRILRGE